MDVSRKQSTPNLPKNCVSGGKKCSFFGKFGALCFLETPFLRFALLPYCRQFLKLAASKIMTTSWMLMTKDDMFVLKIFTYFFNCIIQLVDALLLTYTVNYSFIWWMRSFPLSLLYMIIFYHFLNDIFHNDINLHDHFLPFFKCFFFSKINEIYLHAQRNPTDFIQKWKAMKKLLLL